MVIDEIMLLSVQLVSADLVEKVVEAKNAAASEESISVHGKEIILGVIEYLKNVHKRSDSFLMLLNHGDSEENVQKS